jgi:hypothetical protein
MDRDQGSYVSRRAVLAGLGAALPAAAAGAPALAAPEPEAELLAAVARFREADAAHVAAVEATLEAQARYEEPDLPEALYGQNWDMPYGLPSCVWDEKAGGFVYTADAIERMRGVRQMRRVQRAPTPEEVERSNGAIDPEYDVITFRRPWPEAQARADEIVAAWDWFIAERERQGEISGLTAALQSEKAAFEAWQAAARAVAAARVTTLQGAALKAQAAGLYRDGDVEAIEESIAAARSYADKVALSLFRALLIGGAA